MLIRAIEKRGMVLNHKRTERLYGYVGLGLHHKRRSKGATIISLMPLVSQQLNDKWAMDVVSDSVTDDRRFMALVVVDECKRECPAAEVYMSLGGERVAGVVDQLSETRGLSETITTYNGRESTGKILDQSACRIGIRLHFIGLGKPTKNAYAESLIGKLRDECLSGNRLLRITDSSYIIEAWRKDHNSAGVHSSRGGGADATEVRGDYGRTPISSCINCGVSLN